MAAESAEVHAPTWTPQVTPTSVGEGGEDGHSTAIAMGGTGNHISTVDLSSGGRDRPRMPGLSYRRSSDFLLGHFSLLNTDAKPLALLSCRTICVIYIPMTCSSGQPVCTDYSGLAVTREKETR